MLAHGKLWIVLGVLSLAVPAISAPDITPMDSEEECPSVIRGVELKLVKARGGVVLDFIAPNAENVKGLQLLIGEAGAYVEFLTKMAALHKEELVAYDGAPLPPVDVAVKHVPSGARVTVRADKPKDSEAVMAQARTLKKHWDKNPCMAASSDVATPVSRPMLPEQGM